MALLTTPVQHPAAVSSCPKRMVYGPCGGVGADDSCEVDGRHCPFCGPMPQPTWPGAPLSPRSMPLGRYVVDVRPDWTSAGFAEEIAVLRDAGATGLIGEHVEDLGHVVPEQAASVVVDLGLRVVATVTARARTADEHAGTISAMIDGGVTAVHCVTGDHPAARFGPDATADFVLDGTRLAALARSLGAHVSVAESPASPPLDTRPTRVATKQSAGADVAILNHAGSADQLIEFVGSCRAQGVTLPLVGPVPIVTDRASAESLAQFPGLVLPPGYVERIIGSSDPRSAGIDAAVEFGATLLSSGAFAAVNLSGSATTAGRIERAEIVATIIERIDAAVDDS